MKKKNLLLAASVSLISLSATAAQLDIAMTKASDSGLSSNDMITNNTQPVFIGKATPNSVVELSLAGAKFKKTVGSDGSFLWQAPMLPDNQYALQLTDGNDFTFITFIVDTKTYINHEQRVSGGDLVLTGNAESNAQISAIVAGTEYTTSANANGQWAISIGTQNLTSGDPVQLTAIDIAGNSAMELFSVGVGGAPHHLSASLSENSDSGVLYDNLTNVNSFIEFSGNTTPNSTVTFSLNGFTETLTAQSDGNWTTRLMGYLYDGAYQWNVQSQSPTGDLEMYSDMVQIDTSLDGFTVNQNDGVNEDGFVVISGSTYEPVTVNVTVNNKTYTTHASSDWSITASGLDNSQTYQMTVVASDYAGNSQFNKELITPSKQWLSLEDSF
ncbi:conserved exported hypothetical protein [Vibrio chagasii]|nr:conserved exported hypothetical protein [Vibrio chagasii]CAH7342871.1 conserved exported hypothetical protein [Vibrio chagasii]